MATKAITVHYRKLDDGARASLGQSLQQAVQSAMNHREAGTRLRDDWNLRAETLPDKDTRFTNNYQASRLSLFGTLLLFEPNAFQALLSDMGHVPDVAVAQLRPQPGRQFLKGILYWLIVQDHVFCIQSSSLRAQSLEQHLSWLLARVGAIPKHALLELIAKFDSHAVGADLDIEMQTLQSPKLKKRKAWQLSEGFQSVSRELWNC